MRLKTEIKLESSHPTITIEGKSSCCHPSTNVGPIKRAEHCTHTD